MDERGKVVRKEKIGTDKEGIEKFFSSIERGKVVTESTGIWEYIYEILDSLGFEVTLSNPVKTRIIAEAKIKTDKIDSEILAHLPCRPARFVGKAEFSAATVSVLVI